MRNSIRGSTRGPRGPKNTIRDGGSTALCTFGTVYTIYTFYIFDTVDTIYTIETALHCLNIVGSVMDGFFFLEDVTFFENLRADYDHFLHAGP